MPRDRLDRTRLRCPERILPSDAAEAVVCGRLSADVGHHGADLRIAATGLVWGLTVAARDTQRRTPVQVGFADPSAVYTLNAVHPFSVP